MAYMQYESESRRDGVDLEYEHTMQEQSERDSGNIPQSYDAGFDFSFAASDSERHGRILGVH